MPVSIQHILSRQIAIYPLLNKYSGWQWQGKRSGFMLPVYQVILYNRISNQQADLIFMRIKQIIRTRIGLFITSFMLAAIIFMIMRTIRWQEENRDALDRLVASGKRPVIIFWHEHIFAMPVFLPKPSSALQSPHPDGRVLAYAVRYFSLRPIWGSSNRNALSGLRQMLRELQQGRCAVITPDGPRGPARRLAFGALGLAHLGDTPVIPVAWQTSKCWHLSSWDKTRIPRPFSKGLIRWGEPVCLEATKDKDRLESQRRQLEDLLTRHLTEIDQNMASQ